MTKHLSQRVRVGRGAVWALSTAVGLATPAWAQSERQPGPRTNFLRISEQLGERSAAMLGDWRAERLSDGALRMVHRRSGTQVTHFPDGAERLVDPSGRVRLTSATGAVEWRKPNRVNTRPTLGGGARNSSLSRTAAQRGRISRPPAGVRSGAAPAPAPTTSLSVNRLTLGSGAGPMLACGGVHAVLGEDSPAMPTDLVIEARPTGGFVVRWADRSTNESGFQIEREPAFSGGPRTAPANATSFVDMDNPSGATYRVRAVGATLQSDWSEWRAFEGAPPPVFATLTPGAGFTGPTFQPSAVGEPGAAGYDARVIARWDVVPFQTFSEDFLVGVVAFHMNGVDRVDFSVNGGPWTAVREMQLNPTTGVWEYTARLKASDFADGPVEVRAIAWPSGAGEPRVLAGDINGPGRGAGEHSLVLSANSGGTLPSAVRYVSTSGSDANDGLSPTHPKRSLADALWSIHQAQGNVDGATLYLLAGDHAVSGASWPRSQISNSERWVNVRPAPGVAREQVRVRGAALDNRFGFVRLLRWHGVSIDAVTGAEVVGSWQSNARIWYDGVSVDGVDRRLAAANGTFGWTSWSGGKFITDSEVRNLRDGPTGFALIRNVNAGGLLSDAFSSSSVILNSTVTDINPFTTDAHPDIAQYHGGHFRNMVLYGLRSDPNFPYANGVQGLFFSREASHTDVAVVDCVFSNNPSWSRALLLEGPMTNLYFKNTRIDGPAGFGQNVSTHNIVFDGTEFRDSPPPTRPGVTFRNSPTSP